MPGKEKPVPTASKKEQEKNSDDLIRLLIYIFVGFIPFILIIVLWIFIEFTSGNIELLLKIITGILLIFMPVLFTMAALNSYLTYKRVLFFIDQGSVLLEIKVPKDVKKPLVAMELLLEAFHQTGGEGTFIDRWFKGKTRPWFSLEIVSLEGELHFFFWMRKSWRRHIESYIYAQYPDAEITEAEDYTNYIPFDLNKYKVWGCEYKLTKADPYPIKTYIDYGLDKEKKEEYTVDPINSTLEFYASVEKGEFLWTQILIRAHKKEKKKPGTFFKKMDWKEQGSGVIKKIIKESAPPQKTENISPGAPSLNLTTWQTEMVKSIERNLSKRAFDTGIRSLYISEKDSFNPITISGLVSVFKQYNYEHMNGFAPTRGHTVFDYPWQDFKKIRNNRTSKKLYDSYKWRSYFYAPYRSPHGVMSTEEIATIFHIPGESSHTPSLTRAGSRKGDAPANLPI